jgi:hypothetical protein
VRYDEVGERAIHELLADLGPTAEAAVKANASNGGSLPQGARRPAALRLLHRVLGPDLVAVRAEYRRRCTEREAWLKAALVELLPPAVIPQLKNIGVALSYDALDYIFGERDYNPDNVNAKRLVDAARTVVSQWSADGALRTVRSTMRRTKNGGIKQAVQHGDFNAPCFMCGHWCMDRGHCSRFECLQGPWDTSCRTHRTWEDRDVDCIYGCDVCVHHVYKLQQCGGGNEKVRMACGCIFFVDSMSRMND